MKDPKTVLITGAASGIGLAIATELAAFGHRILLSDLDPERAILAANTLNQAGGNCLGLGLNVADPRAIEALTEQLADIEVDVLINNAGLQHVARLDAFPAEKWQLLQQVMLTGPALLCKALLPGMRERNFGRIINIGSIHALVASRYKSAYVAAKHGLLGLSKVVALENADWDITVNTICPAYVKTPLVEAQIASQAREHGMSEQEVIDNIMLSPMPKKAFIGVDEIVHSVAFLMAPAARNITAQTLVLDGGWTAQ
ncbi:3-hydroxybutyrate dehydrogenase [Shewanella chilikensis]|uniref:3-hydroxybutyrate dehydrogenase n=1 Tax=Shewanella chilikensis TaxID=558541 RepID=UPI001CF9D832|nr:3-hydroxybutyrate dehydrogenase [Shewanella chilikensis]